MKTISVGGRLTRDATTQEAGNTTVTNFTVAVDDRFKRDGQWVTEGMFFDCSLFGDRGTRVAQFLTKGKPVAVSGEFRVRQYRKENGTTGLSLMVRVGELTLLGGAGGQAPRHQQQGGRYASQGGAGPGMPPAHPDDGDDDIPF